MSLPDNIPLELVALRFFSSLNRPIATKKEFYWFNSLRPYMLKKAQSKELLKAMAEKKIIIIHGHGWHSAPRDRIRYAAAYPALLNRSDRESVSTRKR